MTHLEDVPTAAALVVAGVLGLDDEAHLEPKHTLHSRNNIQLA